ncbi:unnamed protein product [Gemmataceae bacterium]|nr:unnamed protein product [Gemmataceae bacterium]VTT99073.1 unnamed protein product [Gemmataceae bacterium]
MRLELRLHRAMLRKLAELRAVDLLTLPFGPGPAVNIRIAVKDAKDSVIRLDLDELLGHPPSQAERRAAHRAIDTLEAAGLVRRLGEARARRLWIAEAAPESDPEPVEQEPHTSA